MPFRLPSVALFAALSLSLCASFPSLAGETLPNGLTLPDVWPPVRTTKWNADPSPAPYLNGVQIDGRPAPANIDLGRQLFVDDFLIESTNLTRTHHRPTYHPQSPVLSPDQPWERTEKPGQEMQAEAAPYSDGLWYDPVEKQYVAWYRSVDRVTCRAVSHDGLTWTKPHTDVEPGTNIVLRTIRDSSTVWLDHHAPRQERFKMFEARYHQRNWQLALRVSSDGVHWSEERAASGPSWDRSTVFFNPFCNRWVASVRGHDHLKPEPVHRLRCYFDGATALEMLGWKRHCDQVARFAPSESSDTHKPMHRDLVFWTGADRLDPKNPDPRFADVTPQLYNLDVFPYESLLVGLFTIWQGPHNEDCKRLKLHKRNEVLVGYSRDGFHWTRPDRRPFLPVSDDPKAWNAGNVQSVGGGCVVDRRTLRFYCSGRTMHPVSTSSTGLALLRRDGFTSLDSSSRDGQITTRPVLFTGSNHSPSCLWVNAAPGAGSLTAEVLDPSGQPFPGFSQADCLPTTGDHTSVKILWKSSDLSTLSGRPLRFRFHLPSGSLYSFWVSSSPTGSSGGPLAAGSSDYPTAVDQ